MRVIQPTTPFPAMAPPPPLYRTPMSKKNNQVAGNPKLDPTLPDVSITLEGKPYSLCFTYGALALAERKLSEVGQKVNLLEFLDLRNLGADRLPIVFFASLVTAHPGITIAEVERLITMKTFSDIFTKVVEAFVASMAEPTAGAENPLVPVSE